MLQLLNRQIVQVTESLKNCGIMYSTGGNIGAAQWRWFILGTMKGQGHQQTEQCNGRELEEEVVSKKETGYEARQGGFSLWSGQRHSIKNGIMTSDQRGPLCWALSQRNEKENNSLNDTVHGQCRTTRNGSDDQWDMGTKDPCDVPKAP